MTDPVNLVDVAISPKDGTGWGIGPGEDEHVYLYHQLADGTIETVLDITAYQVDRSRPGGPGGRPRGVEPVRPHRRPHGATPWSPTPPATT